MLSSLTSMSTGCQHRSLITFFSYLSASSGPGWTHRYIIYTKKQGRIVYKYANWGTPSMWQCYCTLIWSKSLKPPSNSGIKLQIKPILKYLKQQVKKNIKYGHQIFISVFPFNLNSYCCAFKLYYNSNVFLT